MHNRKKDKTGTGYNWTNQVTFVDILSLVPMARDLAISRVSVCVCVCVCCVRVNWIRSKYWIDLCFMMVVMPCSGKEMYGKPPILQVSSRWLNMSKNMAGFFPLISIHARAAVRIGMVKQQCTLDALAVTMVNALETFITVHYITDSLHYSNSRCIGRYCNRIIPSNSVNGIHYISVQ